MTGKKEKSLALVIGGLSIIAIAILFILSTFPNGKIITKQTDFRYEVGIKVTQSGEVISNMTFIDIPIGIAVWASNTLIENCTFIYCDDEGIIFTKYSHNNIVRNCAFYYCCDGIELQESCNNSFSNLQFFKNYHAGVDGIYHSNNNNFFFNCAFYGNVMGVYFKESENIVFDADCIFNNNKQDKVFW